jgi:WD40 repeat protein
VSATAERVERRESPYFGLRYFEERYGAWFFGRDAERAKIITNLRAARLTLLHAESGAGKSSLLRAGVAWRLRELARESSAGEGPAVEVPVVFKSWKDDPVPKLIDAVERAIEPFLAGRPMPELPREDLQAAIATAAGAIDGRLLVILDQFEEYFVYSPLEPVPERFAEQLARCVNRADLPANFLISIREDAYASLGELFKGSIANVYGNYLHIEHLDRDAAESAIRAPLELYNGQPGVTPVAIEPGLVEAVLDQVPAHPAPEQAAETQTQAQAGADAHRNGDRRVATPLLQLVMQTVWEREHDEGSTLLRLSTLQQLEGAESIVDDHLRHALSELSEHDRDVAIDVFGDLVTLSGGKIAVSVPDLAGRTEHSEAEVAGVLAKLDEARIVSPVEAPPGLDRLRYRRYEIFHDVLAPAINRAIAARAAERRARRLRRLVASAVGLLIVALALGGFFVYLWRTAEAERKSAESVAYAAKAEKLIDSEPELGASLALRALRLHDTPEAEQALRDLLPAVQLQDTLGAAALVIDATFSPDGKLIAGGLEDGAVEIWDASTNRSLGTLGTAGLTPLDSVAFSADGKLLVTTYGDGTARIWNVATRRQVGDTIFVSRGGFTVWSAAFNPAGTEIATGLDDGTVRVWDVASHREVGVFSDPDEDAIFDVVWSPDGKLILAAGQNGMAEIWNAADFGTVPLRKLAPPHGRGWIESAAFSPDGERIVTASSDGEAWLWGLDSRRALRELPSRTRGLNSAAFSPDGNSIVTSSLDGTVEVWNASGDDTTPTVELKPHGVTASVLSAAFNRTGEEVVSSGGDGVVRVWDVAARREVAKLDGPSGGASISAAAFSPDGKLIVTGTYDGAAQVWDATAGQTRVVVVPPEREEVTSVGFSPDGRLFATANASGNGFVWSVAGGHLVEELDEAEKPMSSIQFSPTDARRVLTASEDGTARVWDLATGEPVWTRRAPAGEAIASAVFNASGTLVLTAGRDGIAQVLSAATGDPVGPAIRDPDPDPSFLSAHFSHNDKLIVTVGGDHRTARVWDRRTGRQVGPMLSEPGGAGMTDAEFGAGDREILTASSDGTAGVWSIASGRRLLVLAGHSGGLASATFSPDGSRILTASSDGTAKLWDAYPAEEQGAPLQAPGQNQLHTAVFNRAGTRIVTAGNDGVARIWDVAPGHRQVGVPLVEPQAPDRALVSAEFNPGGSLLLTASEDGTARVWSTVSDRQLHVLGKAGEPSLVDARFSPDGRLIVTVQRGTAQVWSATTYRRVGKPMSDQDGGDFTSAEFSPDASRIVTSDGSGYAQIWNWQAGRPQGTISEPGSPELYDAAFSADGHYVVTCSESGTARVWSASTNAQVTAVTEPGRDPIHHAVFGPHGWLLTSSADGYVRIWEWARGERVLRSPRLLSSFDAGNEVSDAEFSADGRFVVTAGEYGAARIFSTELAYPIRTLQADAERQITRRFTPGEEHAYLDE